MRWVEKIISYGRTTKEDVKKRLDKSAQGWFPRMGKRKFQEEKKHEQARGGKKGRSAGLDDVDGGLFHTIGAGTGGERKKNNY